MLRNFYLPAHWTERTWPPFSAGDCRSWWLATSTPNMWIGTRSLARDGGELLRDYADENSCPIFGPDSPTTNPYNPSATSDVLDILITKNLSFPVYLTSCSALSSDHLPVLIDTSCRSSFHHQPVRPNFRRTDWANFQTRLKDCTRWQSTRVLRRSPAPFWWLWQRLLPSAASVTSHGLRHRLHSGWDTPQGSAAEAVADHRGPRSESRGQPPVEVGDPPAQRVKKWPVERDTRTPRSRRPIAVEDDQTGDESSYSISPLVTPGGIALSDSEKDEALADSLEILFQPVTDPSVPAVIEMVDVSLRYYFLTPTSDPAWRGSRSHQGSQGHARTRTVSRTGHWSLFPSERFPSWHRPSMRFFAPITFPKCGSTLEWSLSLNRGRIRHCPLPIGPLVSC